MRINAVSTYQQAKQAADEQHAQAQDLRRRANRCLLPANDPERTSLLAHADTVVKKAEEALELLNAHTRAANRQIAVASGNGNVSHAHSQWVDLLPQVQKALWDGLSAINAFEDSLRQHGL